MLGVITRERTLAPYSGSSLETGEPCRVMVALCKKGLSSVPTMKELPLPG